MTLGAETRATRGIGLFEEFLARKRARTADRLIPDSVRSGRILDIGCGSYPYFLSSIRFREKHGLDRATDPGIKNISGQEIIIGNFDIETEEQFPVVNEFFDVVTMLAVLEHIEPARLGAVLKEIRRVLKPGGIYILTTPAAWTDRLLRGMARFGLLSAEEIDEHKDAYTRRRIAQLLLESGFRRETIRCGSFEAGMNLWGMARR